MKTDDDLRPEYKRSDLGQGVRGKYFKAYQASQVTVCLSPDVAEVFKTEQAVNEALRTLIRLNKQHSDRPTYSID